MNGDDIRTAIMELKERIGRIDERTELMLKRMDKYNGMFNGYGKRLDELEDKVAKHSAYFKIIGGAITLIATIVSIFFSVFNKVK